MLKKLADFDVYMEKILKDWNAPGIGVGLVVNNELVFAKGYGYRDYEKKLPFTPSTLFPIGSNTKLFTAIAAGFLVNEGVMTFDAPIHATVPSLQFHNNSLNNTVTLRDMLAHRTGISRYDMIWERSTFTRKELFDRIKYLEPKEPLRQSFIYNNMMYAAVGYLIELQVNQSWEMLVRKKILDPLEMRNTVYTIQEMLEQPDFSVPFTQKRDSTDLYKKYYDDMPGVKPAGGIISNIQDMSHWLIALMNNGKFLDQQVIPQSVLKAVLEPTVALPNTLGEALGFWELINSTYGMGQHTASYRGHLLVFHGGDINGFHSQVSFMPHKQIGVVTFVIGDHCLSLRDTISYNIYERLLDLDLTPWSDRWLTRVLKGKKEAPVKGIKVEEERVSGTQPSHPLASYAGEYEHPAYGVLTIELRDEKLQFNFRRALLPLAHFHYERFDTPHDEQYGKWSVNFGIDPQGEVDKLVISLDQAEAIFRRRPENLKTEILQQLVGTYETATGFKIQVVLRESSTMYLVIPGQSDEKLIAYKDFKFRIQQFYDVIFEFLIKHNQVSYLKQKTPDGELVFTRVSL